VAEPANDLAAYYPTTALFTAYDIIFFWVSRMIMAGAEFTGKAPFHDIYIHGLVRDKQGRKMSKSLGNGIDPLELIDRFGADALKFTLAFLCAQGQDVLIDGESFKLGSKFANKVWNASRYILMNLEGRSLTANPPLAAVDRWIYSRLAAAAAAMRQAFLSYRYNDAAECAYNFFWNDFCDWYVEATKLSTKSDDAAEKDRAVTVLLDVLSRCLRLLHPLLPFLTEEIWSRLPSGAGLEAAAVDGTVPLILQPYPSGDDGIDRALEADFATVQELIVLIRTVRSECTIAPEKKARVLVRCGSEAVYALFTANAQLVQQFAGLAEPAFTTEAVAAAQKQGAILLAGGAFEAYLYAAGLVDLGFLKNKFTKEVEKDAKYIAAQEAKLANPQFVQNAPPPLVESEREKLAAARARTAKLTAWIQGLE
jgi:valyl-tRNA synthetase